MENGSYARVPPLEPEHTLSSWSSVLGAWGRCHAGAGLSLLVPVKESVMWQQSVKDPYMGVMVMCS